MAKPVRMADIAQRLQISVVSVSKALAGKPGVSEEMRARVVALAQEMGYEAAKSRPEPAGTGNLGVLVPSRFFAENAFYTSLYRSLLLRSADAGFGCMLEIVSPEAERGGLLPALVTGRKVDGVVFMGNTREEYLRAVSASGLPCLLLDFRMPGGEFDCVASDNLEGGIALTRHLLEGGRRRIGFVGSIRSTSSIMDRYLGYQYALREAGIVPREAWLLEDRDENGDFIPLKLPAELPDAFLCSCDEVAYNLVNQLRAAGFEVPRDLAVCGYDDYRFSTLCQPPLTSYRVNVDLMAEMAVSRLDAALRRQPAAAVYCIVPGRLIVRGSTAPASGAAALPAL